MRDLKKKNVNSKTALVVNEEGFILVEMKGEQRTREVELLHLDDMEDFVASSRKLLEAYKVEKAAADKAKSDELAAKAAKPVEVVVAEQTANAVTVEV